MQIRRRDIVDTFTPIKRYPSSDHYNDDGIDHICKLIADAIGELEFLTDASCGRAATEADFVSKPKEFFRSKVVTDGSVHKTFHDGFSFDYRWANIEL